MCVYLGGWGQGVSLLLFVFFFCICIFSCPQNVEIWDTGHNCYNYLIFFYNFVNFWLFFNLTVDSICNSCDVFVMLWSWLEKISQSRIEMANLYFVVKNMRGFLSPSFSSFLPSHLSMDCKEMFYTDWRFYLYGTGDKLGPVKCFKSHPLLMVSF